MSSKRSELDLINLSSQKPSFLLECVTMLENYMSRDIANKLVRYLAISNATFNRHT